MSLINGAIDDISDYIIPSVTHWLAIGPAFRPIDLSN